MGLERVECGRAEVLHGNTKGMFKELLWSHLPESKKFDESFTFYNGQVIEHRPERAHGKFQHEV